ncbi:unnamed protein product [Haemonchus placei]|uniref:Receptor expression-enhancing protein n=1 Tax=Haemonchus placei TaxID=6290 RepID=A0A0N4X378_HAEPC|nr:unnamed protein product [Haemonchus placei]
MDTDLRNRNGTETLNHEATKKHRHVKDPRSMVFKTKEFKTRESLLSVLFRETEMGVVYNIFAAIFVLFFLRALIDDIFTHGMPFHHFWLIAWNFKHFLPTMFVWSLMFFSTFVPYAAFKIWAHAPSKAVNMKSEIMTKMEGEMENSAMKAKKGRKETRKMKKNGASGRYTVCVSA